MGFTSNGIIETRSRRHTEQIFGSSNVITPAHNIRYLRKYEPEW